MSDFTVHTEDYKGSHIEIFADNDPVNPRIDFDEFGKMVCWHRRYDLGDRHTYSDPQEFFDTLADEIGSKEIRNLELRRDDEFDSVYARYRNDEMDYNARVDAEREIEERYEELVKVERDRAIDENTIIIPLYLYDHSGISISAGRDYPYNDAWDSMQVGYYYATRAMIEEEYGKFDKAIKEKARNLMLAEIATYNDYLTNNVYGYVVTDGITGETDSCWGYFGDYAAKGGVLDAAREVAAHNAKSHKEVLKKKDAETARVKGMWDRAAGK